MICHLVGYDPAAITYDLTRYVGAKSKCLRIDKLRRLCPEFVPTPLADGLRATIDWFLREKAITLPPPAV